MRPRRPRPPLAVAAVLGLLLGCGRCGESPAPPERLLPATGTFALLLPRLGDSATDLGLLVRAALSVPAASGLGEQVAAVKAQLGFDPLDPEGLRGVGLDPGRAAGASLLYHPQGGVLLALPLADRAAAEALLARLARDRLGATEREERGAVVVLRQPGGPAALAYAAARGNLLLASGPAAPEHVAEAAGRAEADALSASPAFQAIRAAAGDRPGALLYARSGGHEVPALLRDGVGLALRGTASGAMLRLLVLLPPERAEVWREVLGGEAGLAAGKEELARLPEGMFAAGRLGGSPAALARRLGYLYPAEAAALAGAGLDPVRDLAAHLAPGAAAGLWLPPALDLPAVARSGAAAARDPFRLLHPGLRWRVADAAGLRSGLSKLARALPALGIAPVAEGPDGWSAPVGGGRLAWRLAGDHLYLAGGPGRLEALQAAGARFAAPTPTSRAALEGGEAAGVLDVGRLVAGFRALPGSSFGTGPDGFVMRALVERFLEPASHLTAVSLRLELLPGAARVDLAIEGGVR
ncbi:MAG: hypothetical protein HZB56_05580 [Deltaproteobacteria bacterium]|nr:hypothetical protein [Deltaproteobacteria bacterium]